MGLPLTNAGPASPNTGGGSAPTNTVLPSISGTTTQGSTLTCSTGTWTNTPTSYGYQWYSGGLPVGSNANTYVLQASDVGNTVYTQVTAYNASGNGFVYTTAVGPVTSGATAGLDFSQASNSMYGPVVLWW